MLSVTCKASIKAVVYLASKFDIDEKSSVKEIAEFINENEHTVGKLLQKLVKERIINSTRGPRGGFYLTAKQKEQSIISIVDAIDGKEVFMQCILGFSKCSEKHPCPFHDDFKPIRELLKKKCQEKQIKGFCEKVNDGLAFLIG